MAREAWNPWAATHEPLPDREPTHEQVREAVAHLSDGLLRALAQGPIEDPDECRVCETLEEHWMGDSRFKLHALTLADYHDFYADHGRGEKSYTRCLEIYRYAADELRARAS